MCGLEIRRSFTIQGIGRARHVGVIFDIDETGATVKFQAQTFEAARYSVRKRVEGEDVEKVEWGPTSSQPKPMEVVPWGY